MSKLSPEAARARYLYNKKYVNRYWERKAAEQTAAESPSELPSVVRNGKSDERYIKALETSNKTLNRENRRLVRLVNQYQTIIAQSSLVAL